MMGMGGVVCKETSLSEPPRLYPMRSHPIGQHASLYDPSSPGISEEGLKGVERG